MATLFSFNPNTQEVMPYYARYQFPDQTTKNQKRTMKFQPINNQSSFTSGSTIKFQLPATGYLNPNNTYLRFNARLTVTGGTFTSGTTATGGVEFQQGIESIYRRRKLSYANTPWEDYQDANILARTFIETLCPSGSMLSNTTMIQGIGFIKRNYNQVTTSLAANATPSPFSWEYGRFNYHVSALDETNINDVGSSTRAYCIPVNFGLFQQKNLIPLQFMAGQLTLDYEIADAIDCVVWTLGVGGAPAVPTSCNVVVGQVELVTELLNFDTAFDESVFRVLQGGLPLFFQSWHVNSFSITPNLRVQLNIQESSRSVRYALAVILDDTFRTLRKDSHQFLAGYATTLTDSIASAQHVAQTTNQTLLESYQWRLAGAYYPNQPVPVYGGIGLGTAGIAIDANYSDPPGECYMELMKVFGNMFANEGTWFGDQGTNWNLTPRRQSGVTAPVNQGGLVMAANFTADRGDVITGLNAEEQNDMALIMTFVGTTGGTNKTVKVMTCYDNLVILGTSNNAILIN